MADDIKESDSYLRALFKLAYPGKSEFGDMIKEAIGSAKLIEKQAAEKQAQEEAAKQAAAKASASRRSWGF